MLYFAQIQVFVLGGYSYGHTYAHNYVAHMYAHSYAALIYRYSYGHRHACDYDFAWHSYGHDSNHMRLRGLLLGRVYSREAARPLVL